jgi:hypothetical protein
MPAPTYRALDEAFTPVANPTDILTLQGSATKTVIITACVIGLAATAATKNTLHFLRRSTANTDGATSNQGANRLDSTDPPATAVAALYTMNPTGLGTFAANLAKVTAFGAAIASEAPVLCGPYSQFPTSVSPSSYQRLITLNGANEFFCVNYGGLALPAGSSWLYLLEWVEV